MSLNQMENNLENQVISNDTVDNKLLIAGGEKNLYLLPKMSTRHGLIAGATGTGKTITLQVIAENFSRIGVPVFLADVKGDLAGMQFPGSQGQGIIERASKVGIEGFTFKDNPVKLWDVYSQNGSSIKTTLSSMGTTLLSRLLHLTDTQVGTLHQIFKIGKLHNIEIKNLNDLFSMADTIMDYEERLKKKVGRISKTSLGAIQRSVLALEEDGEDVLFTRDEPAFDIRNFLSKKDGRGVINILQSQRLINSPKVYAAFLLWLLNELFDKLPERGDADKPEIVFFFDEAHLLFADAPRILIERIERLVKLIRSKGVGIFFITQNPSDIPDGVLSQLGNRVQHAMRAFTPKEQIAVRTIAQTFRINPGINVERAITELQIGEALISFLDENGTPEMVRRALIAPPHSRIGH